MSSAEDAFFADTNKPLELLRELADEGRRATELLTANVNDPWSRRLAFRTIFPMIEGTIWALKQFALIMERHGAAVKLSRAQQALLAEERYELDEAGQVKTRIKYLGLGANLRFALSIYASVVQLRPEPDYSNPGWPALLRAIAVRNRLTHPRSVADLDVSLEEAADLALGTGWFLRQISPEAGDPAWP